MHQPELWQKSNKFSILATLNHLQKYKKLLKWKPNESIMEFGISCGTNTKQSLMPILPEDFKELIATDISEAMIEYARNTLVHPKIKLQVMDIGVDCIPQEFENRFDHVFAFFVMHLVQNPRQALLNIYKMLKPEGQIFLTFFENHPVDDVFYNMSKHPKWRKYGHENYNSPFYHSSNPQEEWENLLKETGFHNYELQIKNEFHEFDSEENFVNIYLSVNSTMLKIPKEDLDEYKKDYLDLVYNAKVHSIYDSKETGQKVFRTNYKLFILITSKPTS